MHINDIPARADIAKIISRFESRYIPEPMSGCWLWLAGCVSAGYGHMQIDGHEFYAHRLSFVFFHGPIPDGLYVLHRCDNPYCCNPDHLRAGTPKENVEEMFSRGLAPIGSRRTQSIFTDEEVIAIFLDTRRQIEIAATFGTNQKRVSKIRNRLVYRHLTAGLPQPTGLRQG